MNKKFIYFSLLIAFVLVLTGCGSKCDEGYEEEDGKCVKYVENAELLVTEYTCEEGWHLKETECVQGEMPPIGDGCEEGTSDKIGDDGFCHHYKEATIKYSCLNGAKLENNKCFEKIEAK